MDVYRPDHNHEIEVFGRYLVGRPVGSRVRKLYDTAMRSSSQVLDPIDQSLLRFVLRHPRLLGFIDAGLCIVRKDSEVRRRLFVAFSILEASPEYADSFLGRRRSARYVLAVSLFGVRAVCKALIGVVLVKVVGR